MRPKTIFCDLDYDKHISDGTLDIPNNSPQNLEATGLPPTNGDAPSVQVTFTRPDTPGVITGYNVYYTDDPTLPFDAWGLMFLPETGTPEISGIIRNLFPDTTYYLTATVVNEAGEGPASYLATATTTSGGMLSCYIRLYSLGIGSQRMKN